MQTIIPSRRRMALKLWDSREIDIPVRDALPVTADRVRCQGFSQETVTLPKGNVRIKGAMPLTSDIIFEKNVPMTLSDGTKIYTDIFRPEGDGPFPALVAMSPFGKEIGSISFDDFPRRLGVRLDHTSMLQMFGGPDPAFWTSRGFAVVNVDIRGAFNSEGTILFFGSQYGRDAADIIEWVASLPWCSGKIGMTGCSWLASSCYFAAAQNPEHLTAIAPWGGVTDLYRDFMTKGGVPRAETAEIFSDCMASTVSGGIEDIITAYDERPLMDDYWEDKKARLENITIPAYLVTGYTGTFHSDAPYEAWNRIASGEKWIRFHTTNEIDDFYYPGSVVDLYKFFSHYLKGESNGWEKTDTVRMSVLDPGGRDVINRAEKELPLRRTQYKKLYLNPEKATMDTMPCLTAGCDVYDSGSKKNFVTYRFRLPEKSEITGSMRLHLWISVLAADDLDLWARVEKINGLGMRYKGKNNAGDPVSEGYIRISLRDLEEDFTHNDTWPRQTFLQEQKVSFDVITPVDILIPPIGLVFGKGEMLQLTVGAYKSPDLRNSELAFAFGDAKISVPAETYTFDPAVKTKMVSLGGHAKEISEDGKTAALPKDCNHGYQAVYAGGKYESYLYVPFIPASDSEDVIL